MGPQACMTARGAQGGASQARPGLAALQEASGIAGTSGCLVPAHASNTVQLVQCSARLTKHGIHEVEQACRGPAGRTRGKGRLG